MIRETCRAPCRDPWHNVPRWPTTAEAASEYRRRPRRALIDLARWANLPRPTGAWRSQHTDCAHTRLVLNALLPQPWQKSLHLTCDRRQVDAPSKGALVGP